MMSARSYRIRAANLIEGADRASGYAAILEFEDMARRWEELARLADWQTAMWAALEACENHDVQSVRPSPRRSAFHREAQGSTAGDTVAVKRDGLR